MSASFYDCPILNSPYEPPSRHHALDEEGQPQNLPAVAGRRRSKLITPVPKSRKKQHKSGQVSFVMPDADGLSTEDQEYNPTPIINEIRSYIASWRALPNPADWLRASHNCGTKCHVPAFEEGVETAETPGDGFRAGWLVAA